MRRFAWFATILYVIAAPAMAGPGDEIGYRGWGPRMGISTGPEQAVIGAHLDFGNFADHFRLQPNFELGFGDNRTILAVNGEFAYRFVEDWDSWSPYLGGGVGLNFISFDGNGILDGSDTDIGMSALGGIEKNLGSGDRFFMETKIGLVDAPDLKFNVGWTFY